MTTNKSKTANLRNNNFCVVIIRDRGNDPALDEMWKGLRSLANAYLYRLRGVKYRRRKRPNEDDPSIPPLVAPLAPVPPTAPSRPPAPTQPAPVRPPPPPVSYVEVVKSPPKIGPIHVRRSSPAPHIPVVSRPSAVNPIPVVTNALQSPKAPLAPKKSFLLLADKHVPKSDRVYQIYSHIKCPLCNIIGRARVGKWLQVDHKDWSPGLLLRPNIPGVGFCDKCWPHMGKLVLGGSVSGVVGEWTWSIAESPACAKWW